MVSPEDKARETIDDLLTKVSWHICDVTVGNIYVHHRITIRQFQLQPGHGFVDYLLYVDSKIAGAPGSYDSKGSDRGCTFLSRRQHMPELISKPLA